MEKQSSKKHKNFLEMLQHQHQQTGTILAELNLVKEKFLNSQDTLFKQFFELRTSSNRHNSFFGIKEQNVELYSKIDEVFHRKRELDKKLQSVQTQIDMKKDANIQKLWPTKQEISNLNKKILEKDEAIYNLKKKIGHTIKYHSFQFDQSHYLVSPSPEFLEMISELTTLNELLINIQHMLEDEKSITKSLQKELNELQNEHSKIRSAVNNNNNNNNTLDNHKTECALQSSARYSQISIEISDRQLDNIDSPRFVTKVRMKKLSSDGSFLPPKLDLSPIISHSLMNTSSDITPNKLNKNKAGNQKEKSGVIPIPRNKLLQCEKIEMNACSKNIHKLPQEKQIEILAKEIANTGITIKELKAKLESQNIRKKELALKHKKEKEKLKVSENKIQIYKDLISSLNNEEKSLKNASEIEERNHNESRLTASHVKLDLSVEYSLNCSNEFI